RRSPPAHEQSPLRCARGTAALERAALPNAPSTTTRLPRERTTAGRASKPPRPGGLDTILPLRSQQVEAHPDEQRRLFLRSDDQPVRFTLSSLHEQPALQLACEEEVASEVEIDSGGAAPRGAQRRIGIDRCDADSHGEERPQEEPVEQVVLH